MTKTKEFTIDKFKIVDDGYYLEVFEQKEDRFKNTYFYHFGNFKYKDNPNLNNPNGAMMASHYDHDLGRILKHLLEENEHLKFHMKVGDLLSD